MATRNKLEHTQFVRDKIRTSQLVNRLTKHALADAPIMDASQVNAAKALINKVLPDLASVTHGGDADKPVIVEVRHIFVRPGA